MNRAFADNRRSLAGQTTANWRNTTRRYALVSNRSLGMCDRRTSKMARVAVRAQLTDSQTVSNPGYNPNF